MRTAPALALLLALAAAVPARAQDTPYTGGETSDGETSDGETSDGETADGETADGETADGETAPGGAGDEAEARDPGESDVVEAPKVAVVVVGDPDDSLRSAARRVERAAAARLRIPFDPGLRAALRGEPGERDDGLEEVRRERRRLGLDEARDAPVLASLGRRAGASVVAIVRAGEAAPELLVLDVRNAAFFEGALALGADVEDARIARFLGTRARTAARGAPVAAAERTPAPAAATEDRPDEPARQPDFFEQFWPYLVAGLLLAGLITAIAVTSATAGSDQPVLRFVPGGR